VAEGLIILRLVMEDLKVASLAEEAPIVLKFEIGIPV